jgi:centrin-1
MEKDSSFRDAVVNEINTFRLTPSSIIKKVETFKTGLQRFKGNEAFIKEIDIFINFVKTAPTLTPLTLSKNLCLAAERQLQVFLKKFDHWVEDNALRTLLDEFITGYSYAFLVGDEGAEKPENVLNKILLNKYDTEKKNRKIIFDKNVGFFGVAHGVNSKKENVVVVVFSDRAVEKTISKRRKATGDLTELKQAFDWFDVNKIGRIDPKETIGAMRTLGYEVKNPTLFQIMKELDTPEYQKTFVDFDTFADHITERIEDTNTEEGLRRIFNLFVDDPNQQTITLNTLKKICRELEESVSENDLKEMIDKSASNGTELTFQEFYDFMMQKYSKEEVAS